MMSQLLRSDIKLISSILRFHRGPRLPSSETGTMCSKCGVGLRTNPAHRSYSGARVYFPVIHFPRQFSSKATTNPLLASAKKRGPKKKNKSNQSSTTEVMQENEGATVKKRKAKLLKVKPKELSSYLGLETAKSKSKSTKKTPPPPPPSANPNPTPPQTNAYPVPGSSGINLLHSPGIMSYSTSIDSPLLFNYAFRGDPSSSVSAGSGLGPRGMYQLHGTDFNKVLFSSEGGAFDEGVKMKVGRRPSTETIPGEKDLIGHSEFDIDVELSNPRAHGSEVLAEEHLNEPEPEIDSSSIPFTQVTQNEVNKNNSGSQVSGGGNRRKGKRKLKQDEKESLAKVKQTELEKLAKEVGLNKSLVAYLDMCVFGNELQRGLMTLNYYRHRSKKNPNFYPSVTEVEASNCLLHGYAGKKDLMKVNELFRSIREDGLKPNIQSYAAVLECLGRLPPNSSHRHRINVHLNQLKQDVRPGFELNDLFNKTVFAGNQKEHVLKAIQQVNPKFVPDIQLPPKEYNCRLLQNLNTSRASKMISPAEGLMSVEELRESAEKQLKMELKGTITIKSVEKKDDLENLPYYRNLLRQTEEKWSKAITDSINRNLSNLVKSMAGKGKKTLGLYPFLIVLKPQDYVEIILQEIRKLAEGSETYSPTVSQLYRELGAKVLARYQVIYKKEKGILEKVYQHYQDYIEWYLNPSSSRQSQCRNTRQKWQELIYSEGASGPDLDVMEKSWPASVQASVGRFLYGLIMRDIKIDAQIMRLNSKSEHPVPAFYSIFRMQGVSLKEEIKPHPALVKLFLAASRDELTFDTTLAPMICPPLPWVSVRTGGYLLTPARIVRLPFQGHQQKVLMENCPPENLYPSLDSLNQLGAVPWKINHKVLDTVIEVFNNKGDDSLGIPPPPSECPAPPAIEVNMTRPEKIKVHKTRLALKRQKAEMYSLWCDALYRLSLANHFRDDIFWFPHNMDFRGRVYPCPPHLNHLGADMARSILVFAKGKPLGPKGLDWLKIHLINLTGLKKRDSVKDRLAYANEIIDDILDSADNPLNGRKWWAKSEEPWQTLACCIEIANAIRSGDPKKYICHFPVHQDGSCNGLQHYAALGRDQAGAESVNLAPSRVPQDVYSSVAALVEKLRQRDAEQGVKVAQVLEGFIKRKVIKQTVMTTVYGVTRYGARLQIAKQLKDIPDFPKEYLWPASLYLVGRTFDSLQEMFTSTKEIQDWFTECASLISQVCGQNVEWVTPLGLPVVQPYSRTIKKPFEAFDPTRLSEQSIFDSFERPNVRKQKNAFPPNFIHSLDSSHMMLTSLYSEQEGITFVSVHDCYWTHPCTVEIMNRICREQFVALHSEPILEDLSKFLVHKYSYKESEFFKDGSVVDTTKKRLNQLLTEVPAKGTFDLRSVLKSTYFFS